MVDELEMDEIPVPQDEPADLETPETRLDEEDTAAAELAEADEER